MGGFWRTVICNVRNTVEERRFGAAESFLVLGGFSSRGI